MTTKNIKGSGYQRPVVVRLLPAVESINYTLGTIINKL
jgi:hypothetical protein